MSLCACSGPPGSSSTPGRYNDDVGRRQCAIVDLDTFWQTNTGSIVATPSPGVIKTKLGPETVQISGIEPVLLNVRAGKEVEGHGVEGMLVLKTL